MNNFTKQTLFIGIMNLLILTACNTNTTPEKPEIAPDKSESNAAVFSDSIRVQIDKNLMICLDSEPKKTANLKGEEGGHEEWRYCNNGNFEVLTYSVYAEGIKNGLSFVLMDDQLVQATEEQVTDYWNEEGGTKWNCVYQIKNGKVEDFISLGNGKTEMDNFDPSEILNIFEKKVVEFAEWRAS
ncbi:MAG: hypothetical protein MRY83_10575 [Flavobacteriales bacterium]|nr:hypothetical protein [Flavobacteriales bacterium]